MLLESILNEATSQVSLIDCFMCTIVAIILGGVISYITYKTTRKTTPNFLLTIAILPTLVQVVILLINGNLGTSFAVAGAFSLVKFRSMPGNSKEIISVFWAMATGLGLGMGYITYSIIITIIVAILVVSANMILSRKEDYLERKLKIVIPENLDYEQVFEDILNKYTNKAELMKVKTTNMGSMYELAYTISLKSEQMQKNFLDEIRCRNGNMLVMLERKELNEVEL